MEEVLADTAYSGSTNLKLLQEQNITATIPLNPSVYSSNPARVMVLCMSKMQMLFNVQQGI